MSSNLVYLSNAAVSLLPNCNALQCL